MTRFLLMIVCLVLGSLPVSARDIACGSEYVVKRGDNLTKLAQGAYGSGDAWYVIYNANRKTIGNNASQIRPGQAFSIPCLNLQAKGPSLEKIAKGVVSMVQTLCSRELSTYCKDVTPGGGRVLACFAAHEDKLSGRCEFAIYDAASTLEKAEVATAFLISQCSNDGARFCKTVKPGQGRFLNCLKLHSGKLESNCQAAVNLVKW
jgi:Cysteine rich repeat